jgi:hypothetical protein
MRSLLQMRIMKMAEWIMVGLLAGGIGLTFASSKLGWGVTSVVNKTSRHRSSYHSGRYYRGGKR